MFLYVIILDIKFVKNIMFSHNKILATPLHQPYIIYTLHHYTIITHDWLVTYDNNNMYV